mmetsp:Transcript_69363/g.127981  ORF Transcript_69363/g.127981 Transcript_69363/m.127981 type:complete len:943 (-) Transcript_69363:69-2897(-)
MAAASDAMAASLPFAEAEAHVKELADLEDYYFSPDKETKMTNIANAAIASVDRVLEAPGAPLQDLRARAFFLKGRATFFIPDKERAAEALLLKAIKLEPEMLAAWNALGEVHWALQEFLKAKDCFEKALQFCGENSTSLRNLSMVLRAIDSEGDAALKAANYTTALEKAKAAVALDAEDALSWETLGNAYVGDFFINAKRPDEINRALIAYTRAEVIYDREGKSSPSFHRNRGMAAKFIEDYELALRSYQKARQIGAAGAAAEWQRVFELVQRVAGYVERKGELKGKRLVELAAGVPKGDEYRTLKEVQAGENPALPLAARVAVIIDRGEEAPVIVICCDCRGEFFALSIYNAEMAKVADAIVPMKSALSIKQPKCKQISVTSTSAKPLSYPCVRVAHPGDVTVVGRGALSAAAAAAKCTTAAKRVETAGDDESACTGENEQEADAENKQETKPLKPGADQWIDDEDRRNAKAQARAKAKAKAKMKTKAKSKNKTKVQQSTKGSTIEATANDADDNQVPEVTEELVEEAEEEEELEVNDRADKDQESSAEAVCASAEAAAEEPHSEELATEEAAADTAEDEAKDEKENMQDIANGVQDHATDNSDESAQPQKQKIRWTELPDDTDDEEVKKNSPKSERRKAKAAAAALKEAQKTEATGTIKVAKEGNPILPAEVCHRVTKALVPGLKKLVDKELGAGAGDRLARVERMFELIGRGEVHTEEDEERGKRYAPGYVEGLNPAKPFHDLENYPWCAELRSHFGEIKAELMRNLSDGLWRSGAYGASSEAYGKEWKINEVFTADKWQNEERWPRTRAAVQALSGVRPFEVFFARMPPHDHIRAHSDNLNYILTSHLALELETGGSSITVGNETREWVEGEMLVFDTTYIHSARNDSGRNRYVLLLRFWHPELTEEERLAIHLSHAILANTANPDAAKAKIKRPSWD